jgi:hypothetical protein
MKVVLHIGTEKTGTTSIQAALRRDRDLLAQKGILVPRLLGSPNHMEVAVVGMEPNPESELQIAALSQTGMSRDEYFQACRDSLMAELKQGKFHTILISNEHCHSRIQTEPELTRIFSLLGVDPKDVRVLVYLRRQDTLAVSAYSTRLRLGDIRGVFDDGQAEQYFRYDKLLNFYEGVVGHTNMTVRLFERERLVEGDGVQDFYQFADLDINPSLGLRENQAISTGQALFLQRFNRAFPLLCDGRINQDRGPVMKAIEGVLPGPPFLPARKTALAFYEKFREGNALVRERYFPNLDRWSLFDEDMGRYPVRPVSELSADDIMLFLISIWSFSSRERRWLSQQLEAQHSRLERSSQDRDVSLSAIAGLERELATARSRPLRNFWDYARFRVLRRLSVLTPPLPKAMTGRFKQSAAKRDPRRRTPSHSGTSSPGAIGSSCSVPASGGSDQG